MEAPSIPSAGFFGNPIIIGATTIVLVVVFAVAIYAIMRYYVRSTKGLLGASLSHDTDDVAGSIAAMGGVGGGMSTGSGPAPVDSSGGLLSHLSAEFHDIIDQEEVFNISENVYKYGDAAPVCAAFGARLATLDEVNAAYKKGADWCNYGWIQGQMAVYPTQRKTWEKLQMGTADQRNNCGIPGINGGKFDNPELRFGVNCYGVRPSVRDADKIQPPVPTADMLEYDRKVAEYKSKLGTIGVLPFQPGVWEHL